MNEQPTWPVLPWDQVVDRVSRSVFRLLAGDSAGTCFVVSIAKDRQTSNAYAVFATAWHVVAELPGTTDDIKLVSFDGETVFDSAIARFGFFPLGPGVHDTCLIAARTATPVVAPSDLCPILPSDSMLARGAGIGWLGFPGLTDPEPCFFHGHIAGYSADPPAYFVDGVAVNGVSGGPVFDNRAHLIGLVSSYLPNRVDSRTFLPGLLSVVPINTIRYYLDRVIGTRTV